MKIEIQSPGEEAHAALGDRLMAFNIKERPATTWQKEVFTVLLKDDSGTLRGGARGVVRMRAIDLQSLWLDEDLRREGSGTKIVRAVEDEGKRRGAMSDDPAYSKIDMAIAIGLAVLTAIWLVLYAVVAVKTFLR